MKGGRVDRVRERPRGAAPLRELARGLGLAADYRMDVGNEAVAGAERLALRPRGVPRSIVSGAS